MSRCVLDQPKSAGVLEFLELPEPPDPKNRTCQVKGGFDKIVAFQRKGRKLLQVGTSDFPRGEGEEQ